MFTVYHSNQLEMHKELLIHLMDVNPLSSPFEPEVILVQSPGMAQWLQIQIAEKKGIAANLQFPMPASFIWQQYSSNLPDVPKQSEFSKDAMTWRLMALIPQYLTQPAFQNLAGYLRSSAQPQQQKLYQLAGRIADLFDQYLVYRPQWIQNWEQNRPHFIERQIKPSLKDQNDTLFSQIRQDIEWQGILWRALVEKVREETGLNVVQHRVNLHLQYLERLKQGAVRDLPQRVFIFGISALPKAHLETFHAMSQYCDVHLFFNNPSREYWGDIVDERHVQKLRINQHVQDQLSLNTQPQNMLHTELFELTSDNERLQIGNPLLAAWGKLGRDFLHLLTDLEPNEITAYIPPQGNNLLQQVQKRIFHLSPNTSDNRLSRQKNDRSLTFHSCHSPMREVEVLHDHLLHLFRQDSTLTPKDVVVMVADIDQYSPYIQAVFGQYQDNRQIPYSISDSKLTENDVLVAGFLSLLTLKESLFSAEEVLAFLDIPAIRQRFEIEQTDLARIRYWVDKAGIRFGFSKTAQNQNYNAWKSGLERMLLGYAMREDDGIWQDNVGFDASYGLKGQLTGLLAEFTEQLYQWHLVLQQERDIGEWCDHLNNLIDRFFAEDNQNTAVLFKLKETVEQLRAIPFNQPLAAEVIAEVLHSKLNDTQNSLKFLVGRVSFCTLLPMRAIPFKVICLLGMNDGQYPRQQTPNSFDLMQYHRQKGDRFRREDDRYLFLEALLSAQEQLYISYVGRSLTDNQPKEPSVLVSQLLDYLCENSAANKADLVYQYPMTIFSAQNFSKSHRTFAGQWLPALQEVEIRDFVQPLAETAADETTVIDLERLIEFVQNPVKFFFEKRLGVYFRQDDELIADTENFALDQLAQYQIRDELLNYSEQEFQDYFARLKVKGVLPHGRFAQVHTEQLRTETAALKKALADYLQQEAQTQAVDIEIALADKTVRLQGNIGSLYGERKQRVDWRAGSLKDKDRIKSRIYYLALNAASNDEIEPAIFYDKKGKGELTKILQKLTALQQLAVYVQDYLHGETQMVIVPTEGIKDYLALLKDESAVDFEQCAAFLENIATPHGFGFQSPDLYWQRLLVQTTPDFCEINLRAKRWFENMF